MVIAIMEKNDGLERCLEDDFICSVQEGDDDNYLKKYVIFHNSHTAIFECNVQQLPTRFYFNNFN